MTSPKNEREETMNCDRIRERLTQYLLGDLDEATMEEIRAHLETCDGCRAEVRKVEPTLDLLRDALATATVPERLTASRRARIFGEFAPRAKRVILWVTHARPRLVAAAAVLVIGFILVGTMMPAMSGSRERAQRTASMSKLSQVGKAVQMYAMDNDGRLPDDLDELGDYVDIEALEESAASGERYEYVAGGLTVDAPDNQPIAIDRVEDGANVLHVDGSVTYYSGNEMREKGLEKGEIMLEEAVTDDSSVRLGLDLAGDEAVVMAELKKVDRSRPVGGGAPRKAVPGTATRRLRRLAPAPAAETVSEEPPESPEPIEMDFAPAPVAPPPPARQPASVAADPAPSTRADTSGRYFQLVEERVKGPDIAAEGREMDEKKPGVPAGAGGYGWTWDVAGSGSVKGPETERQSGRDNRRAEEQEAGTTFSPQPTEFNAVQIVKSPVIMRGVHAARGQTETAKPSGEGGRRAGLAHRGGEEIRKSLEDDDYDVEDAIVDNFAYREGEKADKSNLDGAGLSLFSKLEAAKDQAGAHDDNGVVNGEAEAGAIMFRIPDLDESKIMAESAPADTLAFGDATAVPDKQGWVDGLVSPDPSDPSDRSDLSDLFEEVEEETQIRYAADATATHGKMGHGYEVKEEVIMTRNMEPLLGDIPITGRLFARGKKKAELEDPRRDLMRREEEPTEPRFKAFGVNPFFAVKNRPFSTFSIDVDTASYTLARNYMLDGFRPPAEAVRTEEFVNFFDHAYKPPRRDTFKVYTKCAPSKFGHGLHLLKIGVKGRRLGREEQRQAVLTFLVDTSGSMNQPDRIGLVKKSLHLLVEKLSPGDLVAIVQYDSHARLVLEHTPASQREAIDKVIDALQCGGSTNLEEGMHRAYEIAGRNFVGGGENRVLVLSDGVANLGTGAADDILSKVEQYRDQGIYCSVFGFGMGTYDDEMLESLANKGDGTYSFIDSGDEAKRVFVDELAATLNTIAADVKIQVEFNPEMVKRYRQMGYENRQLKKEDFRNDAVDAGEVGSGQSVTALYELDLKAVPVPLRNRRSRLATVRVRYRRTDNGKVEEIEHAVTTAQVVGRFDEATPRFRLAACAAEFAEILRGSPFAAGTDFEDVAAALRPVALDLHLDRRVQELQRLVQGAGGLSRAEY